MKTTINITNVNELRQLGMDALIDALGPVGMIRYLEQFDNGGEGDYTKEKYDLPEYTIEEILKM